MSDLQRAWKLRNAMAAALELAVEEVETLLGVATVEELVEFLDGFSPARAPGPDWVGTFDRLVEHIWDSVDPVRISALEAEYRARGPIWVAYANSFTQDRGQKLRAVRWHPKGARRHAIVLR
ncbi:MAG TPA: hypothetical protein VIO16_10315 [Dehalococcoidia bacterium]|jgi:hypothetical protein